jgi:glycosyltransferase involved in cell wall biosynthesis
MPIISVLTAAYAPSAKFLPETMRSVLSQKLPDGWELEWVVQEDGPAPGLEDLLSGDSRIKYAANSTALSIGATRNLALSRVAGDLVQVLDHDDVLLPGALTTMIPAFSTPKVQWAIGQADDLLPDGTREEWPSALPFGQLSAGAVNNWAVEHDGNWPIHCAGLIMRTATVRALGGWAGLPYDDDIVMFSCLSEIADGYNEPSTTWLYRQHPAQVTRSDSRREWSDTVRKIALQRAASVRASGLTIDETRVSMTSNDIHTIRAGAATKFKPKRDDQ